MHRGLNRRLDKYMQVLLNDTRRTLLLKAALQIWVTILAFWAGQLLSESRALLVFRADLGTCLENADSGNERDRQDCLAALIKNLEKPEYIWE